MVEDFVPWMENLVVSMVGKSAGQNQMAFAWGLTKRGTLWSTNGRQMENATITRLQTPIKSRWFTLHCIVTLHSSTHPDSLSCEDPSISITPQFSSQGGSDRLRPGDKSSHPLDTPSIAWTSLSHRAATASTPLSSTKFSGSSDYSTITSVFLVSNSTLHSQLDCSNYVATRIPNTILAE
jgi:hypothetical protein